MRTRLRTLLLSAAFALAAVSQAAAGWDSDCLSAQADPLVVASIVESAPAEEARSVAIEPVAAVDELSTGTEAVPDLVAAEVVVPMPEDIDLQVAMEMATLLPSIASASEAPGAATGETSAIEVETTGSLSASLPAPHEASEQASLPEMPDAE